MALPVHHQLDVRVDYSWKWGPAQMTAFLDLQNTYLNESIVTYFYSYDFSQRTAFTSLPLIPSQLSASSPLTVSSATVPINRKVIDVSTR